MITLSLGRLKPGMVLAEPVHNFQGILLLDMGAKLTENNIQILKSWGVIKISVEGESQIKRDGDSESENEASIAIQKELKEKFSDTIKDPVMVEIMRVAGKVLEERFFMIKDTDNEQNR